MREDLVVDILWVGQLRILEDFQPHTVELSKVHDILIEWFVLRVTLVYQKMVHKNDALVVKLQVVHEIVDLPVVLDVLVHGVPVLENGRILGAAVQI